MCLFVFNNVISTHHSIAPDKSQVLDSIHPTIWYPVLPSPPPPTVTSILNPGVSSTSFPFFISSHPCFLKWFLSYFGLSSLGLFSHSSTLSWLLQPVGFTCCVVFLCGTPSFSHHPSCWHLVCRFGCGGQCCCGYHCPGPCWPTCCFPLTHLMPATMTH